MNYTILSQYAKLGTDIYLHFLYHRAHFDVCYNQQEFTA